MCKKFYTLTKLSSEGFVFETSNLEYIFNLLADFICTSCVEEGDLEDPTFSGLPVEERIDTLLGTPCGAEFMLERFNSYTEMVENR